MANTNATKKSVDRSRINSKNVHIYRYLREEELAQLTDEEFEILQTKINLPHFTTAPLTSSFFDFHNGSDANGLKRDKTILNIYKRIIAAHINYSPCFYTYSRIFIFCHSLGVTNLYDIGCGDQLQASFLMYAPEMNYTGIDPRIFHDYPDNFVVEPAYINELFEQFTGSDRIKYIKDRYPLDLPISENNIATCINTSGFIGNTVGDDNISIHNASGKDIVAALTRDFERVVLDIPFREFNLAGMNIKDIIYNDVEVWINPFEKYYDLWKKAMPDYEFYRLGERNFIFGTKVAKDRENLEKNYTLIGDHILTGAIDVPWHTELLKPVLNP